jgi:hypothetical protein
MPLQFPRDQSTRFLSKFFEWRASWKRNARIWADTFSLYLSNAARSDDEVVKQVAASSTSLQVICWPCLDEFNSRSQHGKNPDYGLALGQVSVKNAFTDEIPRCTSCNMPMSFTGVRSDRQLHLQECLAESEQYVKSSLAYRAAPNIAKLSRRK